MHAALMLISTLVKPCTPQKAADLSHHADIVVIIVDQWEEDSSASSCQLTYHKPKIATAPVDRAF